MRCSALLRVSSFALGLGISSLAAPPAYGDDVPAAAPKDAAAWATELRAPELERRRQAIYALWNLGPAAKDVVPAVATALRDDDAYVRSVADKILATFRQEKVLGGLDPAIPELLLALADPRVEVRRLAAANLWRVGWPVGPPPPTFGPALVKALADPDAAVRASVAAVVVNFGPHVAETWPALVPLATDLDKEVRLWSLQALATLRAVECAPLMIAALSDPDAKVRAVAIGNLAFPSSELAPAVPKLVAALKDPDADVRRAAAFSLGALGAALDVSRAVDRLVEMLKDLEPATQVAAATGLEGAGSTRSVAALLAALDGDPPPELRAAVVSALGAVGPEDAPKVVGKLEDALQDDDDNVRLAAAAAFSSLGASGAASVPALLGARGDSSPGVRSTVLAALVAVGGRGPDVVDALAAGLKDDSLAARNLAANQLAALGADAATADAAMIACLRDATDAGTRAMLLQTLAATGASPKEVRAAALATPQTDAGSRLGVLFARARFAASEADVQEGVAGLVAALEPTETRWAALNLLRQLGAAAEAAVPKIEAMAVERRTQSEGSGSYDLALLGIRGHAAKEAWGRVHEDVAAGRIQAVYILGLLGPAASDAVPELVAQAGAKDLGMRLAVCRALGKIGVASDAVKAALDAARHDPIPRVRRAAYDAQSRSGLLPK